MYSYNFRTHIAETSTTEDQDALDGSGAPNQRPDSEPTEPSFTPTQCLFCNANSPDFEANLCHMSRSHSLFIPAAIDKGSLTLAVDLETLARYMHLVIHTYHECLFCHTQRQSARAVQQHMTGKGHCRVDLEDDGSEFRDFYESPGGGEGEGDSFGVEMPGSEDEDAAPLLLREGSLLLSSGKLLSHRSAPAPKHHRPLSETQKPTRRGGLAAVPSKPASPPPPPAGEDGVGTSDPTPDTTADVPADIGRALTRLERRAETNNRSTLSLAMARMSLDDRAALAHLPAAEQRSVVLRQFKQQDRARHESRRFWGKVELRGNKTMKM
ncbi:putative pre-60s factor [Diaporthe ampelina]|uniref:Putative pre-60s factor n=1 Tax=Diaporthe ampelina TaxID=1214573 RepID=A0A0G2FUA0_9PEZI|nr:putative pre-60s factor [Diaporthe ampelina]